MDALIAVGPIRRRQGPVERLARLALARWSNPKTPPCIQKCIGQGRGFTVLVGRARGYVLAPGHPEPASGGLGVSLRRVGSPRI